MIVISPHLDDAVFSIGQILAATPDSVVVTVLAGDPPDLLSAYDQSAGFRSSGEAVRARRAEDHRAMTLLGGYAVHGPFLDGQYGLHPSHAELVDWIRGQLEGPLAEHVAHDTRTLVPLGIQHPDHVAVAAAAREAVAGELWIYEELPYRVNYPELTAAALAEIGPAPAHIDGGPYEIKAAAVECYQSQLSPEMRRWVGVPERVWRLR